MADACEWCIVELIPFPEAGGTDVEEWSNVKYREAGIM